MEVGKLTVTAREKFGKGHSRRIRAQGLVPGICYGPSLEQPLAISVDPKALKLSLDPLKRRNTLIDLTVQSSGGDTQLKAMLKDFQIDPLRREVTHVDLVAIDSETAVEAEVPLRLTGKAKGTIIGGIVHLVRRTMPVTCKPADIPGEFVIDVTPLDVNEALHVSDVEMPAGVKPALPDRLTLVTCVATEKETATKDEGEDAKAEEKK